MEGGVECEDGDLTAMWEAGTERRAIGSGATVQDIEECSTGRLEQTRHDGVSGDVEGKEVSHRSGLAWCTRGEVVLDRNVEGRDARGRGLRPVLVGVEDKVDGAVVELGAVRMVETDEGGIEAAEVGRVDCATGERLSRERGRGGRREGACLGSRARRGCTASESRRRSRRTTG